MHATSAGVIWQYFKDFPMVQLPFVIFQDFINFVLFAFTMSFEEYKSSLAENDPPSMPLAALALWYDAKGNWQAAHEAAQDINTPAGAWVHAYLHRKEGDRSNAAYWYHQAGKKMPDYSLAQEWEEMAELLLVNG
jgi:hypothetical protein